jgi:hypothetical protein
MPGGNCVALAGRIRHPLLVEFFDEHIGPKLIGNGHILGQERKRRAVEWWGGQRVIDSVLFTDVFHGTIAVGAFHTV